VAEVTLPLLLPLPAAATRRPLSRALDTVGSSESVYVLFTAAVACAGLALRSWGLLTASVSSVATPTATPIPTRNRLGTNGVREACGRPAQAALRDGEHGGCSTAMGACFACRCSARSCTALRALNSPVFQFRSSLQKTTTDPSASPTGVHRRMALVCRTHSTSQHCAAPWRTQSPLAPGSKMEAQWQGCGQQSGRQKTVHSPGIEPGLERD
jgi:hypothetical protein